MSRTKCTLALTAILCSLMLSQSPLYAAGQVLPDELTVNVGDIDKDGADETLVLTKRSIRSKLYKIGTWTAAKGFTRIEPFPVSTYRGYVEGKPVIRVNANVEPGGMLSVNFSDGRTLLDIGPVALKKIDVPAGKCTALMSTGNKVIPVKATRLSPTPGGYLVPPQPMRRIEVCMLIFSNYVNDVKGNMETAVSRCEQRLNDGDFAFARDIGVAWEVTSAVMMLDNSRFPRSFFHKMDGRRSHALITGFSGSVGRPHYYGGGWIFENVHAGLDVANLRHAASGLAHEAGHNFNGWHEIDRVDCMNGALSEVGPGNIQRMLQHCAKGPEELFPAVMYNGALPPLAMNDFANTTRDMPVTIDVLDNDYDGNGDTLLLQGVSARSWRGGTVALSADKKKAVYTPAKGYVGVDRFSYTVVDSTGVPSRTGKVKVDVRIDGGLASYLPLDKKDPALGGEHNGFYPDLGPYASHGIPYFIDHYGRARHRGARQYLDDELYKGVKGKALFHNGVKSQAVLSIPNVGDPGRASLSVSLWALFPPVGKIGGTLICKGGVLYAGGSSAQVSGWGISYGGKDGGFHFVGNVVRNIPGEAFALHSTKAVEPNKWYHLVMVMDRKAKKLRAWVNNEEVIASGSGANIPDGVINGNVPLVLFGGCVGKGMHAKPALVDELRIYTSVLTRKQVAELYAEGRDAEVPKLKIRTVK